MGRCAQEGSFIESSPRSRAYIAPIYNRNGWLGLKTPTYLLSCLACLTCATPVSGPEGHFVQSNRQRGAEQLEDHGLRPLRWNRFATLPVQRGGEGRECRRQNLCRTDVARKPKQLHSLTWKRKLVAAQQKISFNFNSDCIFCCVKLKCLLSLGGLFSVSLFLFFFGGGKSSWNIERLNFKLHKILKKCLCDVILKGYIYVCRRKQEKSTTVPKCCEPMWYHI